MSTENDFPTELNTPLASTEATPEKNPDPIVEVLPAIKAASSEPVAAPESLYDSEVGAKVARLAKVGLNKTQVCIAAKITPRELERVYLADYNQSQASFQEEIASAAMDQVRIGNPQMIQYMCKARLGWSEHNVVEHTGSINAVVSAKPLSKEEFEQRYLKAEDDFDD